ncbi:LmeA family phospholipid-binding protein [Geodermatophilus sp. SYSU D00710]
MSADQRSRARRGRRTVVLAVTVVLGTALLLWAAEWLARSGAESVLARTVQEQTGGLERPTVEIHGGPVLVQALRGRYDDVVVEVGSISSGPLRLVDHTARLEGVYLSFHDLVDGSTDHVFAERSEEEALVTYDDLDRYLGFAGRDLDVEPEENGQVRFTGSVDVLGELRTVSALARVEAEEGALLVRPTRLDAGQPLEGIGELLTTQRFTFPVPLDALLFEQGTVEVTARSSGLAVRTAGRDVVFGS